MKVWVIEDTDTGHEILGVSSSVDAAVSLVKKMYPPPYVVRWEIPRYDDGHWKITGHFSKVPGYAAAHSNDYELVPYEVDG